MGALLHLVDWERGRLSVRTVDFVILALVVPKRFRFEVLTPEDDILLLYFLVGVEGKKGSSGFGKLAFFHIHLLLFLAVDPRLANAPNHKRGRTSTGSQKQG